MTTWLRPETLDRHLSDALSLAKYARYSKNNPLKTDVHLSAKRKCFYPGYVPVVLAVK